MAEPASYMEFLVLQSGAHAATADLTRFTIGDGEWRMRLAVTWRTGDNNTLAVKWGGGSDRSWQLRREAAEDRMQARLHDGTSILDQKATAAGNETDGVWIDERWTVDLDDGGGNSVWTFYQRTDMGGELHEDTPAWSQIGTVVTAAVVSGINDSTVSIQVPGPATDSFAAPVGKYARFLLYDGIGGTIVSDLHWSDPATRTTPGDNTSWDDQAPTASNAYSMTGVEDTDWQYVEAVADDFPAWTRPEGELLYTRR